MKLQRLLKPSAAYGVPLLSLVVLASFGPVGGYALAGSPDYFNRPKSVWDNQLDTTPLEIGIAGHVLAIPRNYVSMGGMSADGTAGFVLGIEFPSLSGATKENFGHFERAVSNWGANIVSVHSSSSGGNAFSSPSWRQTVVGIAAKEGVPTSIEGLSRVPAGGRDGIFVSDLTYVHRDDGDVGDLVYICLASDPKTDSATFEKGEYKFGETGLSACFVEFTVDNLHFLYKLHFSLLKNWRDLHHGIVRTLTSFIRQ